MTVERPQNHIINASEIQTDEDKPVTFEKLLRSLGEFLAIKTEFLSHPGSLRHRKMERRFRNIPEVYDDFDL